METEMSEFKSWSSFSSFWSAVIRKHRFIRPMDVEWIDDVKPGQKLAAGGRTQTEWWKRSIALQQLKE